MKLRSTLLGLLCVTSLTACSGGAETLSYDITVKNTDASKVTMLMQAAERVITRRLAAAKIETPVVSVVPSGASGGTMKISLPDSASAEATKTIVEAPFTFDIRIEKVEGATPTEPDENWEKTDVTGDNLLWVQAVGNRQTGEISADLQFDAEGTELLADVFKRAAGKSVGIFVRDLLVSKLKVEAGTVSDHVVISGIPSARVAEIFADDLNVGLHTVFTLR